MSLFWAGIRRVVSVLGSRQDGQSLSVEQCVADNVLNVKVEKRMD